MRTSAYEAPLGSVFTVERLFHAAERAFWTCAATGWSVASREALRRELLTLRTNLDRCFAASRNDARRLTLDESGRVGSQAGLEIPVERLIAVPAVLAARLAACGEDREEMYRIRDEFERFERRMLELDAEQGLFPMEPRGEADAPDSILPKPSRKTWKFFEIV